jgi:hypothetical protein
VALDLQSIPGWYKRQLCRTRNAQSHCATRHNTGDSARTDVD